jgi:hypothetical protein
MMGWADVVKFPTVTSSPGLSVAKRCRMWRFEVGVGVIRWGGKGEYIVRDDQVVYMCCTY